MYTHVEVYLVYDYLYVYIYYSIYIYIYEEFILWRKQTCQFWIVVADHLIVGWFTLLDLPVSNSLVFSLFKDIIHVCCRALLLLHYPVTIRWRHCRWFFPVTIPKWLNYWGWAMMTEICWIHHISRYPDTWWAKHRNATVSFTIQWLEGSNSELRVSMFLTKDTEYIRHDHLSFMDTLW